MAADTHFADGLATNYDNNSIIFLFTYWLNSPEANYNYPYNYH
jgi:hypothetical protein